MVLFWRPESGHHFLPELWSRVPLLGGWECQIWRLRSQGFQGQPVPLFEAALRHTPPTAPATKPLTPRSTSLRSGGDISQTKLPSPTREAVVTMRTRSLSCETWPSLTRQRVPGCQPSKDGCSSCVCSKTLRRRRTPGDGLRCSPKSGRRAPLLRSSVCPGMQGAPGRRHPIEEDPRDRCRAISGSNRSRPRSPLRKSGNHPLRR